MVKMRGMNRLRMVILCAAACALSGCVATHQENAALQAPWPGPQNPALLAFLPPLDEYPSVGGDILKGTSPADQAAARAAAVRPLASNATPPPTAQP